jgi:hypothetical protein
MSFNKSPVTADIETLVDWMKDYTKKKSILGTMGTPETTGQSFFHNSEGFQVKFTCENREPSWVTLHTSVINESGYWYHTYTEAFIFTSKEPTISNSRKFSTRDKFDAILDTIFNTTSQH